MSEYIVCPYCHNPLSQSEYVKVVRCRDCKHSIKADLSGNWYECMKPDCDGDYARWDVEPDGFCSWGEREDGDAR